MARTRKKGPTWKYGKEEPKRGKVICDFRDDVKKCPSVPIDAKQKCNALLSDFV